MVTVKVCVGTYCYLLGGEELAKWRNYIPQHLQDKVTVIGSSCLGCKEDTAKPPYVRVGDKLIEKATPEKIIEEIERQLEEK